MDQNGNGKAPENKNSRKLNLPTTYQLVKLAVLFAQSKRGYSPRSDFSQVYQAWEEAEAFLSVREDAKEYLKAMRAGLFTMGKEQWEQHKKEASATCYEWAAFQYQKIDTQIVLKSLFRDRDLSQKTRLTLTLGLLKFARDHKLPLARINFTGTITVADEEMLSKELARSNVPLWICRWLVETRQAQLAENKRRDYILKTRPSSVKA